MKLTIGPRDYHVRAGHNADEWKVIAAQIQFDPADSTVSADSDELLSKGVRLPFLNYLLRNDYLREAH